MRWLNIDNIILFHEKIIQNTGGGQGIRDQGLIESALNRAFMSYAGKDLYHDIIDKIAATTHSLISNHGFIDGNKRIGVAVMLLLLKMNNISITYSQQELIELGLGVAEGRYKEIYIKHWIEKHIN